MPNEMSHPARPEDHRTHSYAAAAFGIAGLCCASYLFDRKHLAEGYAVLGIAALGMRIITVQSFMALLRAIDAARRAIEVTGESQ